VEISIVEGNVFLYKGEKGDGGGRGGLLKKIDIKMWRIIISISSR
jgi:hypothetical protein